MNVAPYYSPPLVEDLPSAEPQRFAVRRVLADAQQTFFGRPLALVLLLNLGLGLSLASEILVGLVFAPRPEMSATATLIVSGVGDLVQLVLSTFFAIGTIRVSLAAARREPFGPATLFSGGDVLATAMGSNLAATFLVVMGLLLFVVPGVVLAIGLGFTLHLVADRRADAIHSLWRSLRITRGQRLRMVLLAIATAFLLIGGLTLLGVGVFIALPIAHLVWAHAYVTIVGE